MRPKCPGKIGPIGRRDRPNTIEYRFFLLNLRRCTVLQLLVLAVTGTWQMVAPGSGKTGATAAVLSAPAFCRIVPLSVSFPGVYVPAPSNYVLAHGTRHLVVGRSSNLSSTRSSHARRRKAQNAK